MILSHFISTGGVARFLSSALTWPTAKMNQWKTRRPEIAEVFGHDSDPLDVEAATSLFYSHEALIKGFDLVGVRSGAQLGHVLSCHKGGHRPK